MHAAPQKRRPKPRYPSKLEVQHDPELLRRHLPATWAANPELATAAALLLTFALPVRATNPPEDAAQTQPDTAAVVPSPTASASATSAVGTNDSPLQKSPQGVAVVAPLFEHGDGRAASGCVVVSPPSYLTEEEAWQIIDEELARAAVRLPDKDHLIAGVEIPLYAKAELYLRKEDDPLPKPTKVERLRADRADPKRKIVLEFISIEDPPEKSLRREAGTATDIEFKGEAEALRVQVAASAMERIYFGALYDPACINNEANRYVSTRDILTRKAEVLQQLREAKAASEQGQQAARAESKRLLRLQVQDFIHWLQAQGAI